MSVPVAVFAHALHDSAALGIHPAGLAVAVAGILVVGVALPSRAEDASIALPQQPRVPADATVQEPWTHAPAEPPEVAEPRDVTLGPLRRGFAGAALAVVGFVAVVGALGPDAPNLAALLVANVVLPTTVLVGLFGVAPRAASATSSSAPSRTRGLTVALLVPVALTHLAGSGGGRLAAAVLVTYLVVTAWGRRRHGPTWWATGDPLGVLARAVGRISPRPRDRDGVRQPWLAPLWTPLDAPERLVLGVVLAATLARAARFVAPWQLLIGGQPLVLRTLAAGLLVGYVFVLLALLDRAVRQRTGEGLAGALVPVVVVLVLANDLMPALFSVNFAGTLLSDPFGTGADVFGTAQRRIGTGLLGSPLVWLYQLVVVLLGGVLGATVQRDLDRARGRDGAGRSAIVAGLAAVAAALLLIG